MGAARRDTSDTQRPYTPRPSSHCAPFLRCRAVAPSAPLSRRAGAPLHLGPLHDRELEHGVDIPPTSTMIFPSYNSHPENAPLRLAILSKDACHHPSSSSRYLQLSRSIVSLTSCDSEPMLTSTSTSEKLHTELLIEERAISADYVSFVTRRKKDAAAERAAAKREGFDAWPSLQTELWRRFTRDSRARLLHAEERKRRLYRRILGEWLDSSDCSLDDGTLPFHTDHRPFFPAVSASRPYTPPPPSTLHPQLSALSVHLACPAAPANLRYVTNAQPTKNA